MADMAASVLARLKNKAKEKFTVNFSFAKMHREKFRGETAVRVLKKSLVYYII